MIEILCKYHFFSEIFILSYLFSVPNWKNASSNSTNLGKSQFSLTVKNGIDACHTKPMTYSCFNTTVSF